MSNQDRPEQKGQAEEHFGLDDVPTLRKLQRVGRKIQSDTESVRPETKRSQAQWLTFKTMADICEAAADAVEMKDLLSRGADG